MNPTTNLILVDDTPAILRIVEKILEGVPDIQVIDTALTGTALMEKLKQIENSIKKVYVEFILMDMIMHPMDGWETTRQVKKLYPHIKVIAFSSRDHPEAVQRSLRSGADGFLSKYHFSVETLKSAIKQIREGKKFFTYPDAENDRQIEERADLLTLTPRELALIQLLGENLDHAGMAAQLQISEDTLAVFLKNIKRKLNVDTQEAIIKAAAHYLFYRKGAPD
ncbi:response regulator transcription factor [Flavilitoribacter nigricans]|uniref:DNA-binding response regulator n=1 Tax=Flavilitoribacter nigricans (strain ATCC 23147 / DSM 23189 / NBRC 102662 / NCIMB 1420 / SS-2) TaxID=1122177 RepID=A0A2D0NHF1_FLAN2|nr:response regulator transcription factor [Flavilitoribacter nigricans]PHN07810.1 hypothetical protein CRP01_04625 [Flavilitoribacter nigricans DSM 23189 = NBRC 102662]